MLLLNDAVLVIGSHLALIHCLKYLDTKTHKTLAQEHRLTPKAVESRLARIRKKLKDLLLKRLDHEAR